MFLPKQDILGWRSNPTTLTEPQGDTGSELAREWANPSVVVATVLMFVGGNVVQEALAQSTGKIFTPVAFSFGWPAYALSGLKGALGEGRLLPTPDYHVKVFNLMSGYYRINKNWVIGRIVRDHEAWISKADPSNNSGMRISIFEAEPDDQGKRNPGFRYGLMHLIGAAVMILQLFIATIPTIRTNGHEWGILAITGFGTFLSLLMGSLPQWTAEKMPITRESTKVFALTAGNGSRDIMIIKGEGRCPDLECLATLDSPITASPWKTMQRFSLSRKDSQSRAAKMVFGRPVGYQITRLVCIFETLGWLFILISLAGISSHTWCLIAVGAIGLIHNTIVADLKCPPEARNLPVKLLDTISTRKIMDGLMDLEMTHKGCGRPLLQEFFPGQLRSEEEEWWESPRNERAETPYDQQRLREYQRRQRPRSMLPMYNLHATPSSHNLNMTTETVAATETDVESARLIGPQDSNKANSGRNARITVPILKHQEQARPPPVRRISSPPPGILRTHHQHHRHHQYHHGHAQTENNDPSTIQTSSKSSPSKTMGREAEPDWSQWNMAPGETGIVDDPNDHPSASTSYLEHDSARQRERPKRTRSHTLSPTEREEDVESDEAEDGSSSSRSSITTTTTPGQALHLSEQPERRQRPGRRTRRVSFVARVNELGTDTEIPANLDAGLGDDSHDHDDHRPKAGSESPTLADIAGEIPKRPFWD